MEKLEKQFTFFWYIKTIAYTIGYIYLFKLSPYWIWPFIIHWYLSLFMQSGFLHRYAAHQIFTISPFTEKIVFICIWLFQGASYLSMKAYGILHIKHHSATDTEDDVHSPAFDKNIVMMMLRTALIYNDLFLDKLKFSVFEKEYTFKKEVWDKVPKWDSFDTFASSWFSRISWGIFYLAVYFYLNTFYNFSSIQWLIITLLVLGHWGMGPIHGAIINWWGHTFGYRNHEVTNTSRNIGVMLLSFPMNFIMIGEDLHNNHHHRQSGKNFAHKWWEYDVTHTVLHFFHKVKIIRFKNSLAT